MRIYLKESINLENLEQLKLSGEIVDYEVDGIGVKITKKIKNETNNN